MFVSSTLLFYVRNIISLVCFGFCLVDCSALSVKQVNTNCIGYGVMSLLTLEQEISWMKEYDYVS